MNPKDASDRRKIMYDALMDIYSNDGFLDIEKFVNNKEINTIRDTLMSLKYVSLFDETDPLKKKYKINEDGWRFLEYYETHIKRRIGNILIITATVVIGFDSLVRICQIIWHFFHNFCHK